MGRQSFFLCFVSFAMLAFVSSAEAKQCNLSLAPTLDGACPVGAIGAASPNKDYDMARIEPKTDTHAAIDAFGYCRYIGNTSTIPIFVPFSAEDEWRAYLSNHPETIYFIQCSRGGSVTIPPNIGHDPASNQCISTPGLQSVVAPYKPANVPGDYVPPPVAYECQTVDGSKFTETAVATLNSHDSGYGPSNDVGWAVGRVLYTYDGQCGPANGVSTNTAPTSGLCHVGVPTPVIGTGPFTWICGGGTGGGRSVTCKTGGVCENHIVEEKPCRCEEGHCYRPVYMSDGCGHTSIDKSKMCDKPEPQYNPQRLPNVDETNQ
jgi:hypothetical protein